MAASFSAVATCNPGNQSSIGPSGLISKPSDQGRLVVIMASHTILVTSWTLSGFGGSAQIGNNAASILGSFYYVSSSQHYITAWEITNVATGIAGTVQANMSGTDNIDMVVVAVDGVDPTYNLASDVTRTASPTVNGTLVPTNLTSLDLSLGVVGGAGNTLSQVSPNNIYLQNSLVDSLGVGYNTGTDGVTLGTVDNSVSNKFAIRFKGALTTPLFMGAVCL